MSSPIRNYLQTSEDLDNLYGGNFSSAKHQKWLHRLLVIFLIIVLVGGFVIMAIGIWTLEAEYGNKHLSMLISAAIYHFDSILMISVGSAIIAITVLGLCGLCTQYRCLMGLHVGLSAFMSIMLFVAGILGYVFIGELEDKVKKKMEDAIVTHYGIHTNTNSGNHQITEAWDAIQHTFQCCGAYGDANSSTSWALYKQRSQWWSQGFSNKSKVPGSCCDGEDYLDLCTGRVEGVGPPSVGPPLAVDPASLNYTLYTTGCFDVLQKYLLYTGAVIGSSAIVVGILNVVELVLSICIYRMMPGR